MNRIEEKKRLMPGAEMFFAESVAQYLAEVSEEAYDTESEAEGLLLGAVYHDELGYYVVITGATQDVSKTDGAVGWFRSSEEGCIAGPAEVRRSVSLFGYERTHLIMIDSRQSAMAMFVIENGVARKANSVMIENY